MTGMNITVCQTMLPHEDDEASLAFYRDAHGVEVVQEPTDQPYGIRDCAVRGPMGNLVRIRQLP